MAMRMLGGRTSTEFMRNFWQRRPLCVRGAFEGFVSPLTPEELLTLACEDGINARLLLEKGGANPWELIPGPFEPEDLASLPEDGWTVLVGDVDQVVPLVADLHRPFGFLPNWRIDDIQVSYAPPGASAGPHVDSYDVFLLQGYGKRRWQISHVPAPDDVALLEDADAAILKDFSYDTEWVLEPGDLLYLPPRIPHWGVAVDACMTYSVGFRSPHASDVVAHLCDAVMSEHTDTPHFSDAGRAPAEHPGYVDDDVRMWVRQQAQRLVLSDEALDHWFGTWITTPDVPLEPLPEPMTESGVVAFLQDEGQLQRRSVGQLAHMATDTGLRLFAAGRAFETSPALVGAVRHLTGRSPLTLQTLAPYLDAPGFLRLLTALVNTGCLVQRAQ